MLGPLDASSLEGMAEAGEDRAEAGLVARKRTSVTWLYYRCACPHTAHHKSRARPHATVQQEGEE